MAEARKLAEPLGSLTRYALVEAERTGRTLKVTSGVRSNDQQIALRRSNCGTTQYQIYEAPASSCSPPTARPGSSNHQTGRAVDMDGAKSWMADLLSPYHVTRPVAGEDWHYEWRGSDAAADLNALAGAMEGAGYDDGALTQVFGTPPQPATAADQAVRTGTGIVGIATRVGVFVIDTVLPGSPAGTIVGAAETAGDALAAVNRLAAALRNPQFWVRVGIGWLGAALVLWGGILLSSELLPKGVTDGIKRAAKGRVRATGANDAGGANPG